MEDETLCDILREERERVRREEVLPLLTACKAAYSLIAKGSYHNSPVVDQLYTAIVEASPIVEVETKTKRRSHRENAIRPPREF